MQSVSSGEYNTFGVSDGKQDDDSEEGKIDN